MKFMKLENFTPHLLSVAMVYVAYSTIGYHSNSNVGLLATLPPETIT